MREILFRGKRIDNGEWVDGDLLQGFDGRKYIITLCDNTATWNFTPRLLFEEVVPETVGQFTGLLDKNGTKIFEGDILVNRLNRMVDKEPYQIIYDEYSGGWLWSNETGCDPFYQEIAKNGEVIGNIHDNPELLMEEL